MPKQSKVKWLGAADEKVREDLKPLLEKELQAVFCNHQKDHLQEITIHDCVVGYNPDQARKIVLAVEVQRKGSYRAHIVKLGEVGKVARDYEGWQRCAGNRYVGSRIFVPVLGQRMPGRRAAAIYQDAYTLFGPDQKTQKPEFLEDVVNWAVMDDKPDPASVERVIVQLFSGLHRWFYWTAKADQDSAIDFYRRRLDGAWEHWIKDATHPETDGMDPAWKHTLRQDAIWLFCGQDLPDVEGCGVYLDAYDFVSWALQQKKVPASLVGRSHGDLNGRNILVGVQRGEAESPVVIDYGEMSDNNVLAWDFAKLEVELKTRLLPALFEDEAARQSLLRGRQGKPPQSVEALEQLWESEEGHENLDEASAALHRICRKVFGSELRPDVRARCERALRLAFFFEFESLLATATMRIEGRQNAENRRPPGNSSLLVRDPKIDKLLRILLRIRQEAALSLGYEQPGRQEQWRDEYYFALAVYGLSTAKWANYERYWTESAYVSAGVAVAQMRGSKGAIRKEQSGKWSRSRVLPSYRVPLWHARKYYLAGDIAAAERVLTRAQEDWAHAVPLVQEHALILAEQGRLTEAQQLLEPLKDLCLVFGDFETLSRIGRVLKNVADNSWQEARIPAEELYALPPGQYYRQAYLYYAAAFWISGHYFPGVNASTLALLSGQHDEARQLAERVLDICRDHKLSTEGKELYWVLASEGEAMLVSGRKNNSARAADYYEAALQTIGTTEIGMIQSAWNQVCRLWQALGPKVVDPVVKKFISRSDVWARLTAGPVGDCGYDVSWRPTKSKT